MFTLHCSRRAEPTKTRCQAQPIGWDVKLQCEVCGKYVNLTKDQLKSRTKKDRAY